MSEELSNANSYLNQIGSVSEQDSNNENYSSTLLETKSISSKVMKSVKMKKDKESDPGQKGFKCSHCPKVLGSRTAKSRHEWTHTGERKYKCSYCPNAYLYANSKIVHERTHTGEKPFVCSFCSKSFTFQNSKIRHERTHTRNYPYKCTLCTASFNTQSLLTIHTKTHLKKSANEDQPKKKPRLESNKRMVQSISMKIFKCSFCPKLWRNAYERTRHERIHTLPYKCTYCPKAFSERNQKLKHEKTHLVSEMVETSSSLPKYDNALDFRKKEVHSNKLRKRTHRCSYCFNKYFTKSARLQHERVHTGERPFSCKYCPRLFAHKCNMISHEKIHIKYSTKDAMEGDTQNQSDMSKSVAASSLNMKFEESTDGGKDEMRNDVKVMEGAKPKKRRLIKKSKTSGIFSVMTETKLCSLCLRSYQGSSVKYESTYTPSLCPACSSAFFQSAPPCR